MHNNPVACHALGGLNVGEAPVPALLPHHPPAASAATETSAQRYPITLVTAYFELDYSNKRRSARTYHAWAANLLPFVRWPMVIFCDEQSLDTLKRLRGDKPAVYCVTRLEEFSVYRYRDIIRAHCETQWPGSNPDIALVWNEKANFVRRAIDINTFGSEMFFWCDIGFHRRNKKHAEFHLSDRIDYPNLRVCRARFGNSIALFGHRLFPPSPATHWVYGSFYGGSAQPLRRFCDAFYDCFAGRVQRGGMLHSDEPVLRDAVNAQGVSVRVFLADDIWWLCLPRWLRVLPPPPALLVAYTVCPAIDFRKHFSVTKLLKNGTLAVWRKMTGFMQRPGTPKG